MISMRKMVGLLALGALISTYGANEARSQNFSAIQSRIDFLDMLIQQQDASIQNKLLTQQANLQNQEANLQSITPTNSHQAKQIAQQLNKIDNRLGVISVQLNNPPLPPAARMLLQADNAILRTLRTVNKQLDQLAAYIPRTPAKAQQVANRTNQLLLERTNLLAFNLQIDSILNRNAGTAFRAL